MDKPIHPAAAVLPLMVGTEFDALALDIKAHGLREPITLHPDGSILDGRNRYRACKRVEVEPRFVNWTGEVGTEVEFVISANLHRRHLDAGQRAMYAARIANSAIGAPTKDENRQIGRVTNAEAAEMMNVGERYVRAARTVLDEGKPELVEAVQKGEVPVYQAERQVKEARPKSERHAAAGRAAGPVQRERAVYWRSLSEAVTNLSSLPDPKEIARFVPQAGRELLRRKLEFAVKWLNDFNQSWSEENGIRGSNAKDEDAA